MPTRTDVKDLSNGFFSRVNDEANCLHLDENTTYCEEPVDGFQPQVTHAASCLHLYEPGLLRGWETIPAWGD